MDVRNFLNKQYARDHTTFVTIPRQISLEFLLTQQKISG